uniref:Putative secreted protein n=1 Tax=Rhipicephalus microplus TaxID=6941 RepID=A0A6M2DCU9_RHIMP
MFREKKKRMTSVHVARSLHLVSAILLRLAGACVAFTHQLSSASRLPSPFVFILRGKTDSVEFSDAQPPSPRHRISLLLYIRHVHLAFPRAF